MFENDFMPNRIKLILFCLAILLFGIFLGMNSTPTVVWIFGWTLSVPLIIIALVCFLLGCICGWVLSILQKRKIEEE